MTLDIARGNYERALGNFVKQSGDMILEERNFINSGPKRMDTMETCADAWINCRLELEAAGKNLAAVEYPGIDNALGLAVSMTAADLQCSVNLRAMQIISPQELHSAVERWTAAKMALVRATGKSKGDSHV